MPDRACPTCGFKLWLPIVSLRTSHLGLYDDARFPGRCLLVLDEHVEAVEELSPATACAFMEDAQDAARAIRAITDSPRVNYAILGNTESHVHWHLIPRQPDQEPAPSRPPWEDRRPVEPLDADDVTYFVDHLRKQLT